MKLHQPPVKRNLGQYPALAERLVTDWRGSARVSTHPRFPAVVPESV